MNADIPLAAQGYRRASSANPLVPEVGCMPETRSDIALPRERVLHIALRDGREKQPGLARALRSIADGYAEVDWQQVEKTSGPEGLWNAIKACALMVRPTLVFMQIQRVSPITPELVTKLREHCDDNVVIVNWDGDQHHEPDAPARRWFRELGIACDTSLVVNTAHPAIYASHGVRNPGYLQIGIDPELYRPHAVPTPGTPAVVMLASRYAGYAPYKRRQDIADALEKWYGPGFGVYGGGWSGPSARPMLNQDQEAGVYTSAIAAVSMSIRADLPRYTSDRLFRALACGAYVLVERFPDMEGLGLRDEVNCQFWSSWGELENLIVETEPRLAQYHNIRHAGAMLAHTYHTWEARMPELLYIVDTVRAARG
jgi:hypothetical protein